MKQRSKIKAIETLKSLSGTNILKGAGIDFTNGNDAPKGGKNGNYVIVKE